MKTFTTIIAAALLAAPAVAEDVDPSVLCADHGVIAGLVMDMRQAGVSYSDALDTAAHMNAKQYREVGGVLVEWAYEYDRETTARAQEMASEEFTILVERTCYQSFDEYKEEQRGTAL